MCRSIDDGDAHVLPGSLGLDANDRGIPWTPREVVERGRQEARETGTPNPDPATCIILGLTAAAQLKPLKLSSISLVKSRKLVRLALFDLGPSLDKTKKHDIMTVCDRLMESLQPHLEDDTSSFNHWFFDNLDNIVHQISKRKSGPLSRDVVRQAIVELVFRSFLDVGLCVHTFMDAFRKSLPEPLTATEQSLFASLYLAKPKLGDLPLILLHDRFDILKPSILDIMERPRDHKCLAVLLRLLEYYAFMASKKREGDRNYKKRSNKRNHAGRVAQALSLNTDIDKEADSELDDFQAVVGELRERRRAKCSCGITTQWRGHLVEEVTTEEMVVYDECCGGCSYQNRTTVSMKEFTEAGEKVLGKKAAEAR